MVALSPEQRLGVYRHKSVREKFWSIHRYLIHSQIFDPFTVPCFKYVWKNQNKYELSHTINWITRWQMIDSYFPHSNVDGKILSKKESNYRKEFKILEEL